MWRPALRCDSAYRQYVESLSESTSLDKNQLMRLMMFVAAHSPIFKQVVSEYRKEGVTTLPNPAWKQWEDGYWLNQTYKAKTKGIVDKNVISEQIQLKGNGGVISFTLPPF